MTEMTIGELLAWAKDITLGTAVAIFILQLWRGELLWKKQHLREIELYERLLKVNEQNHTKREADLERLLDKAEKRGDEWLNMSVQQNKLVDKSLAVTAVTVTTPEKPPA